MQTIGTNVVIIRSNQVLLVRRTDFDIWALPGGGVDNGESIEFAAIREIKEEAGLDISIEALVGIYSKPKWVNGGDNVIVFRGVSENNKPTPDNYEVSECKFFNIDSLPENIFPFHIEYIQDACKKRLQCFVQVNNSAWPFPKDKKWAELIQMRKESGLSGINFFKEWIKKSE